MIALDERTSLLHRPVNDVAGLPGTALNLAEHPLLPWEKRCHALLESLNARGVVTMEEKRRGVEDLGKTIYVSLSYYEKWIMSAAHHLLEKGHVTSDELSKKLRQVRERFA